MKKRIISALLALATVISLSACNTKTEDTEANQAQAAVKQEETQKAKETEKIKNAVTDETEPEETTTSSAEKTALDRNENINVSMIDFGTVNVESLPQATSYKDETGADVFNVYPQIFSVPSSILTTSDDKVEEITDYQKVVDTIHLYNNMWTTKDLTVEISDNKFNYQINPIDSDNLDRNCYFKTEITNGTLYTFVLSSKDFKAKYNVQTGNTYYDETTDTVYITLERDDDYVRGKTHDKRLGYRLYKNETEVHPMIFLKCTEDYLNVSNIVFVKPDPSKMQEPISLGYDDYSTLDHQIGRVETLAKRVSEHPTITISYIINGKTNLTAEESEWIDVTYTLESVDDNNETLTFTDGTKIKVEDITQIRGDIFND